MPPIDLVNPDTYESGGAPHDLFDRLRANAPAYRHPGDPPFWAITRHEDVVHVSRHPELFSSAKRLALFHEAADQDIELQRLMMLNQDPPEHTRRRSLVNRGFTPRTINALEEHIRDICHRLLKEVPGDADFVTDIAAPLPLYVICELLGAPVEDRQKIFDWSNTLIGGDDPEYQATREEARLASAAIYSYAHELAESPGRSGIVATLLRPDENGEVLADNEFELFVLLLVVAGNETTRNAASGGMLAFFEHPGQWVRLRDEPALVGPAVDEIVRWVSPVNLFRRTAVRETSIAGEMIGEGDKVVVFYSSANRDESVFAQPYTFDIARDPNPHIGFGGGGPHFCLGAHLARLELKVLFETLAERMPDISQRGPARRLRSNFINGIKELPVRVR